MLKLIIQKLIFITFAALYTAGTAYATIAQSPLFLTTSVDPNVLLNMSIEAPIGGAAYNDRGTDGTDSTDSTHCGGRISGEQGGLGVCYTPSRVYLGYFDSNKCYIYDRATDQFNPDGAVNSPDHDCIAKFSGNFMNWATMTAMDMFVLTMTGGNRVVDTIEETVIRRTRKSSSNYGFPRKFIAPGLNVSPSTVTPWPVPVYIRNEDFGVKFGTSVDGDDLSHGGTYKLRVRVCEKESNLEANCTPYGDGDGSYYKPEGLIQNNADHMRFGVTSYSNTSGDGIQGGVLRSNIKYVGTTMPDGNGGTKANPLAEILPTGIINTNSNPVDARTSGVTLSGVITYLNKFSDFGYKANDPAGELFYESIRYFKNLGPTSEYLIGNKGGFPILRLNQWQDPIQYECQKNFIIAINDANPWKDKRLPGTHFTSRTFNGRDILDDFRPPSTPDLDINVTNLTNTVGDLEGLNGTEQFIGCTALECDSGKAVTKKTLTKLGEVFGTPTNGDKENSYYIAGLAYYANTQDIRTGATGRLGATTDFAGKQTISTFMIDTQEYSLNPLLGQTNMLWLAGKYGGFIDDNADGDPNNGSPGASTTEWDADSDGVPDNYVLATEPDKLVSALSRAFYTIKEGSSSATSVAANATRLNINSKIYQARFDSATWTGQLLAFDLNTDGSIGTQAWDAATLIPTENSRKIFSYDATSGSSTGIVFEYANLNTSQQALMNTDSSGGTDTLGATRADYIRGDTSTEEQNGGAFRDRSSLLGDVINSDPWFAGTVGDFGYTQLDSPEGSTYAAYLTAKLSRTPAMYFSANDAMLHAINAVTGSELFTYVPDATIASLSTLSDPLYGCADAGCIPHRYSVDGSPLVGDAYFGSAWHSVMVNTLGAGGKGLFALDVTKPSSFSASNVLWEISTTQAPGPSSDLTDFSNNLGYTLPQASVVKMHNGNWAAVVANGYESASHKAVLYLIDIQTGHIIKSIDTGVGNAENPNGLSTPIAIDEDGDSVTDSIYAGDLLGNLWKFDVSGRSSNTWGVAYSTNSNPAPLYRALDALSTPQPITAKLQVGRHPDGGLMVYFGTGKYYANNDQIVGDNPQIQTFYGIRDQGAPVASRSRLQEQQILSEATMAALSIDIRVTSDTTVNYSEKDGWYMDLNVPTANGPEGERVVSVPLLRNGRLIVVTLIPSSNPCGSGGSSWLMELDAVNGSRLSTSPFDINNDGAIDLNDLVHIYDTNGDGKIDALDNIAISGIRKYGLGIIKAPSVLVCDDRTECLYTSGSGSLGVIKRASGSPTGRQSWRQLR
ncbi:MAG: hypothetical protein A6F71_04325 [Cycloclasticus sp. symbiont of Poecilosclerida sp. M]|nr:MAG: hypothetical protein A6F71_04325 [Cycloclasticus sp. symbiont of Poecilosclerida sp. M]